jgi:hypothetical protein
MNVHLSIPCPKEEVDLADPFTFTMNSVGSLLIEPQDDLTVAAAKVVKIQVDKLQISLRTPAPVAVNDESFETRARRGPCESRRALQLPRACAAPSS